MNSSLSTSQNNELNLVVPLGGNSFITKKSVNSQAAVTTNGWINWSSASEVFSVYFRINTPGILKLYGYLNVTDNSSSMIQCTLSGNEPHIIKITGSKRKEYLLGQCHITKVGYVKLDVQRISKTGHVFANVQELFINGSAVDQNTVFVKNNECNMFYWGRRGPSIHLNFYLDETCKENVEWFYSELTVPKGCDPIGSFFMANGFGEGYFGIQVNSETERKILFSVWSPCETDDPNCIPEGQRIKCLRKGSGVQVCEFGCEGSGGQSFLRYTWKSETTYKFLLHAQPNTTNASTTYTAYFYAPELSEWLLIASFSRPCIQTWLTNLHSFVENFIPETGHITRKAYFDNQWIRNTEGQWKPLHKANFTGDETARKEHRLDYDGGIENGRFYLRHCGFFIDNSANLDTIFSVQPKDKAPEIHFDLLGI
uniref:DUF5077 domain-containing protein n=1 Tax=Acrobeloides nanus TaxID=290746 RepID=A0A914EBZ4_9BILA